MPRSRLGQLWTWTVFLVLLGTSTGLMATSESGPIVQWNHTCGLNSLVAMRIYLGKADGASAVYTSHNTVSDDSSLADLCEYAGEAGLYAQTVRATYSELARLGEPAILHVQENHFVAVLSFGPEKCVFIDPPRKPQVWPRKNMESWMTGHALIVSDHPLPRIVSMPRWASATAVFLMVVGSVLLGHFIASRVLHNGVSTASRLPSLKKE